MCADNFVDNGTKCIAQVRTLCEKVRSYSTKTNVGDPLAIALEEGTDLKGAKVRLVAKSTEIAMEEVADVPLNKTGKYLVQIVSASSEVCQLEDGDVQVVCPAHQEKDSATGACLDKCKDQEVRTKENVCVPPAVKASIKSDTLELKLTK